MGFGERVYMINILIDNNGIDIVQENLDYFLSIKDKACFFINATVIEELVNMGALKKERFVESNRINLLQEIERHNQKIEKCKKNLLALFHLSPQFVTDSIFVLGYSRLGCARLGDCETYDKLVGKNKSKNVRDSIIGASAFNDGYFVLTNDRKFRNKMEKNGIQYLNLDELQQMIKSME